MDYARFFTKRAARRPENLIRKLTEMRSKYPEAISLAGGMPNPNTFPFKSISVTYTDEITQKLMGSDLNTALQYGPSQGHLPLVDRYRQFQQKWHAPPCKDWDVTFMAGSQDGFCKVLNLVLEDGEPIMVQIPTYTGTLGAADTDICFRSIKTEEIETVMDFSRHYSKMALKRERMLINILESHHAELPLTEGLPGSREEQTNLATFRIEEISFQLKDGVICSLRDKELHMAVKMAPAQGIPVILQKFCTMQRRWHTPPNNEWDVLVVNGSQDGIWRVFDAFINRGDPVMIQTPVYFGVSAAIHSLAPDFIGIQQDADGIIPEEIENACEERIRRNKVLPKLLYVNPVGANPTGAVLTTKRKRKVYELAQKYNFLIVEDDPYFFLHFLDEQPESFLSMDTDGRVIRLDSFSKIISAGLRIGVVTANKEIIKKLITHVENSILHTSSLSQMLIYKLFETWSDERFEQHFKEIQSFYKQKRDVMLAAVEKHLTGLAEWSVPKAGMFLWIRITAIENALELAMEKFVPNGVFIIPGNAFNYNGTTPDQHLRLCYSFATSEEVERGLSIIAKIIREEAATPKNIHID